MKKLFSAVISAGLVFGTNISIAQDDWKVIPVEIFTCSYNEGKGPEDLAAFVENFNEWADTSNVNDYAAWILTPYYFGPGQNSGFDFGWLGASKTAAGQGKAQDQWLKTGLTEQADANWTCSAHGNMASVNYKPAKTPKDGVITMSDCSYRKGATFDGLATAMTSYAEVLSDAGSDAAIFHWYPIYGGGGENYDFKWVESHKNLEAMGEDYDRVANGRLFVQQNQLMGHLTSCDASRAYIAKSIRHVELR